MGPQGPPLIIQASLTLLQASLMGPQGPPLIIHHKIFNTFSILMDLNLTKNNSLNWWLLKLKSALMHLNIHSTRNKLIFSVNFLMTHNGIFFGIKDSSGLFFPLNKIHSPHLFFVNYLQKKTNTYCFSRLSSTC
uniref:Uncharacterized protein n=1 Tax=Caulerpa cliftonii TaxID=1004391 RepID=A0A1C9JBW8_9CHLO|nr:hypothetical protein [Caulerpa cliftonii]AOP19332.1 hypothetical protein [Caulerpa cliftonii]